MGQDQSSPIDEHAPTQTLNGGRTLDALAKYIRDGKARKIVVMTGAGISTSAGIPDFRSPDTGLYANLARLELPYAEAVFDISYFRQKPEPFYTLAQELYPGKYRPTVTHSFIKLLQDKGLLLKLFTQNIDCLEREAGVSDDKIVEAHGSFARQSCIECKSLFPDDLMKHAIDEKAVPHCLKEDCGGLVKPEIVFFGEQLPASFFENRMLPGQADLCITMGTSLSVQPFASLPQFAADGVPRLLINSERVGDYGTRSDDVLLLGDCDEGVRKLADACGWRDELEALWTTTAPKAATDLGRDVSNAHTQGTAEDEVDKLARQINETLKTTDTHKDFVDGHVERTRAREESTTSTSANRRDEVSPSQADMLSSVARALNGGDSDAKYVDRYVNAKTGATHVRVPTSDTVSAKDSDSDNNLGHIFPFASKKPSL